MKPIGFVICVNNQYDKMITKDKIYPYYEISDVDYDDFLIVVFDDSGKRKEMYTFLDDKPTNNHQFDFYHYPEFPKDTSNWTEEDWVHYHLKYG